VSIFIALDAIAIFLLFPETQYRRDTPSPQDQESAYGKAAVSISVMETPSKKSYLQELVPWSGINPGLPRDTSLVNLFIRPWPLFFYPANLYSTITFSVALGCLTGIGNTAAPIFQGPPYNFSPGIQGLGIYLPGLIGSTIGALCGGPLTDTYTRWRTRKNHGVFEPEGRLVAMIIPIFVVPAGVLMFSPSSSKAKSRYGLGIAHVTPWPLPFIGSSLVYFGIGCIPTITMTYGVASVNPS
jgi:hypothetical protein